MAKLKVRTIYDKDGVKIQADKYNWILILNGNDKDPSYFEDIGNLFESLAQQKLRLTIKKNFENLSHICNDLKERVSEVGNVLKNSPKWIIEH